MTREERDGAEFEILPMEAERVWDADGVPILRARAVLPQPAEKNRKWRRIRSFYRLQSRAFFRYCQGELRPLAEREYRAARENSAPLPCFQADLSFRETYRAGRRMSLCTELRENAAPGVPTRRLWGDTWDLESGYPAPLSDFFPPRSHWKRKLLAIAAEEIERQEKRGLSRYYPDWRRRLRRFFNPLNYYLTPEGAAFFFPMQTLAPPVEGIPIFLCPWAETAFSPNVT
ncbi:MAG: DUF3298 domain-containing protein [Oscillibacter sp.]|nr:DUF3298 domain-containing protein [Oscillibacter sp.]